MDSRGLSVSASAGQTAGERLDAGRGVGQPAAALVERLAARGILAGVPVSRLEPDNPAVANLIVLAATELTTSADIAALCTALAEELQ